ncbi:cytochrome c oxidase subunit 3 [Paracoccus sediminis]|uniref:Cytochrome c oxidase subunit 3 n=1 Tax=Paracoccus sediminis TaxID=1214787 RepID=A0A238VUJ3_9RHOB|nr:cytochrome c oxidase subunit 3 [Paracoccus sediminis]TBN51296.1 cytochrome c oxidase subunit 3 [Paracoccus sediminis]SNR37851.1 cytochrome c oxidase subunit 3 [Paracoccus sediminis]
MAHAKNHDYHILPPSIWPLVAAVSAFLMLYGAVGWMHTGNVSLLGIPVRGPWLFLIGFVGVLYVMYSWWADVVRESQSGDHTPVVRIGLQYGFILFIISEVMFFVAWFWNFIKQAMYPMGPESPIKDGVWPPEGIVTFDPWHLPFINTLILLLSGVAVTWAHHALVHDNDRKTTINGLIVAVILGAVFSFLQIYEYSHAAFGLSDTAYAGAFYLATGFHGLHVLIGTIFLAVCLVRLMKGQMSQEKHVGFEAAAWYWHFVDVVWLFLFAVVYVWGS